MKRIYKNYFGVRGLFCLAVVITAGLALSCDTGNLEVKQDFPFEVNAMPVPDGIAIGETVEIRLAIVPEAFYAGARYYIRYFQYEGAGHLRCQDDPPYIGNDLYPLEQRNFRLYYTSGSTGTHSFDIWISDSFGNERQLHFEFRSRGQ
ncbi:conjugal transfer protein TraQ [Flavobacterium album]|uniref:Conjugal transfer protein TraQ n=1 Tax=Flavobacterium album TaxID=2175091 RepID=A0A2S1R0S3_9FLAO|nr:DUF3872 domain-containing protein [Flavobacterium album]AWH86268.1 conjugal transfer protein TraQ [Flavobacterium album]